MGGRLANTLSDMTHHEITEVQAEDLKTRVEKAFNDRDTRAIEDLLGDRMVDHNVLLGGVDLRQRMARALEAFPDAVFSIDQYIFQGNAAAWKWSVTGTHSQEIMGIQPTGKEVTLSGLSAAVLKDGRIVQHWEFSDDQGLLAQLESQTR
jgi:predicted ester cyclase